jgi:hypothetical protein
MNPIDQQRIVSELMDSIKADILARIRDGDVPAQWDGLELRRLVADTVLEKSGCEHIARDKARLRAYNTERMNRNL